MSKSMGTDLNLSQNLFVKIKHIKVSKMAITFRFFIFISHSFSINFKNYNKNKK